MSVGRSEIRGFFAELRMTNSKNNATYFSDRTLVDGTARWSERRLERQSAKCLLVLGEIVAEEVQQRFGLLRAEVDALEVLDPHLVRRFLARGSEDQEEVPDAHADMDVVGIAVAIVLRVFRRDGRRFGGLLGLAHMAALISL